MKTNEEIRNDCTRTLFQMHYYMNDKHETARTELDNLSDNVNDILFKVAKLE